MNFELIYLGKVKSANTATKKDKAEIREKLHEQLKHVWQAMPLAQLNVERQLDNPLSPDSVIQSVSCTEGKFNFVPIVCDKLGLIAKLRFSYCHFVKSKHVLSYSDIDNMNKTLLDSLRCPKENEIPKDFNCGETYCLLSDDGLVVSVSSEVKSVPYRLNENDDFVRIFVETLPKQLLIMTMGIVGVDLYPAINVNSAID